MFTPFQCPQTPPNHHDSSKIIWNRLAMTSKSSLSTYGTNQQAPSIYVHLICLIKLFILHQSKSSLFQTFRLVIGAWHSWRLVFLIKTESKKAPSTSDYPCLLSQVPCPIQQRAHVSLCHLCAFYELVEAFAVALHIHWHVQLQVSLGFSNPIPGFDSNSRLLGDLLPSM